MRIAPSRAWLGACCLALTASLPVHAAERVLALGGDITELVVALGAGDRLVGVDATSLWPPEVQQLPNVGYVRQLSAEGVLSLRPDLVLATHDAGPPQALSQLRAAGARVEQFEEARDVQGILDKLELTGELLGREDEARALGDRLKREAEALVAAVAAQPSRPRVIFAMSASSGGLLGAGIGTAADAAIGIAGGTNAVDGYRGYRPLSAESLVALAPDVLVVMMEQAAPDAAPEAILRLPGVAATPAARNGHIVHVQGQALLGFSLRTLDEATRLQEHFAAAARSQANATGR